MFDLDSPQDRLDWHNAEFLSDLYHIAHHRDLDEHKKLVSLQMLIDGECEYRFGGDE